MDRSGSHDEIRDLLPEVALGTIAGKERAVAIAHIASCPECRQEVKDLSDVADGIFLLVAEADPPAGFEGRVVALIGQDRRQRRIKRFVPLAAAALVASALTAGGLQMAWHDDRELAASYRETLAVAHGRYFKAVPLEHPSGTEAGTVFAYQGEPSWVFVTIHAPVGTTSLSVSVTTEDGRTIPLHSMWVVDGHGSWGHEIPIDLEEASTLRIWQPDEGSVYLAHL
jgi:hypothetical protein